MFEVALPQLVSMDPALLLNDLQLKVPVVPLDSLKKGLMYAKKQNTNIWADYTTRDDEKKHILFYLLSTKCEQFKKTDASLVSRYEAVFAGRKPRGKSDLKTLKQLVEHIHFVALDGETNLPSPPECVQP